MHKMQRMNVVNRSDNTRYFISYTYNKKGVYGCGRDIIEVTIDPEEDTEGFIDEVEGSLEKLAYTKVIVMNYKRAH